MALKQGIYVFFLNHPSDTTQLNYIHFDGNEFGSPHAANGNLPDLGHGMSAVLQDGVIYIFCTYADQSLHVVQFDGSNFTDTGAISGVQTHDRPAALLSNGLKQVYYKDGISNVLWCAAETSPGVWARQVIVDRSMNYGPGAVLRYVPHVLFNDSESGQQLKLFYFDNNTWTENSPNATWLNHCPAAVLAGERIFAIHHSGSDHSLYCNILTSEGTWLGDNPVPGVQLNNSPGACVYGGRVFCFFQGTDTNLWCQVYIGNAWLPDNVQVKYGNGTQIVPGLWYGPCPVTVD
jgi:hypothetical protein